MPPGGDGALMHRGTRRFLPVLAVAGTAAFLSLVFASAPFDPGYNPHASFRDPSSCPKCPPYAGGKPDPGRLLRASVDFCLACHSKDSLGRSHPIQVRPRDKYVKMKVPRNFRLDDDGRMTCLTCHSAHGPFLATVKAYPGQKPENPDALPGTPLYYHTRYVRRTDPAKAYSVLCYGCHEKP